MRYKKITNRKYEERNGFLMKPEKLIWDHSYRTTLKSHFKFTSLTYQLYDLLLSTQPKDPKVSFTFKAQTLATRLRVNKDSIEDHLLRLGMSGLLYISKYCDKDPHPDDDADFKDSNPKTELRFRAALYLHNKTLVDQTEDARHFNHAYLQSRCISVKKFFDYDFLMKEYNLQLIQFPVYYKTVNPKFNRALTTTKMPDPFAALDESQIIDEEPDEVPF